MEWEIAKLEKIRMCVSSAAEKVTSVLQSFSDNQNTVQADLEEAEMLLDEVLQLLDSLRGDITELLYEIDDLSEQVKEYERMVENDA